MKNYEESICRHWKKRADLAVVEVALKKKGLTLEDASLEELAVHDQLHAGNQEATAMVADWSGLKPNSKLLDIGAGLGGTARFLAKEFCCQVTAIDLSFELTQTAKTITQSRGLDEEISHLCCDYSALDAQCFDVIWIQHVDMQIQDKGRLYRKIANLLNSDGKAIWHDWLAGPKAPVRYPVMWSTDGGLSSVIERKDYENHLSMVGLRLNRFKDMANHTTRWFGVLANEINKAISKLDTTDDRAKGRLKRLEIRKQYVDNILFNIEENRLKPFFAEVVKGS